MAVVAANIHFWWKSFQLFLIHKLPWYFLPCFESTGISIQEKKLKIDFQEVDFGSEQLWYFHLWYFLPSLESAGFLIQEKMFKPDFQDTMAMAAILDSASASRPDISYNLLNLWVREK